MSLLEVALRLIELKSLPNRASKTLTWDVMVTTIRSPIVISSAPLCAAKLSQEAYLIDPPGAAVVLDCDSGGFHSKHSPGC